LGSENALPLKADSNESLELFKFGLLSEFSDEGEVLGLFVYISCLFTRSKDCQCSTHRATCTSSRGNWVGLTDAAHTVRRASAAKNEKKDREG